ncbi:MAG: bifunctional riboflavin kinase/FAD synthetase [Candidatus Ratteibacteria bacterium]|nr:bifunctional riboflavin kinase/FAD synthetase [Candidatus Ratteibacteria bacterium]
MEVIHDIKNFSKDKHPNIVMAIGNFDGVHLGHQFILKKVVKRAKTIKGTSLIFTFPVHPLNVLKEKGLRPQLTTLSQKLNLFRSAGMNICLLADFNRAFAGLPPLKFARQIIRERLQAKEIFIGENYRFGKGRKGSIKDFKKWGRKLGFKVKALPLFRLKKEPVSSTRIRELLKEGDIRSAGKLLGRPYTILGEVVRGSKRGISLGFPTANITPALNLILKDGIYAVEVEERENLYRGLLNLGRRPTFHEQKRILEVYLFNYSGDLYGRELSVKILRRLRGELKFNSPHDLINQIRFDIKKAKEFFTTAHC